MSGLNRTPMRPTAANVTTKLTWYRSLPPSSAWATSSTSTAVERQDREHGASERHGRATAPGPVEVAAALSELSERLREPPNGISEGVRVYAYHGDNGKHFFFSEKVATGRDGRAGHCQLEMADINSVPDLRVGPVNAAHDGYIIRFEDWKQFERFADAVDSVRSRLDAYRLSLSRGTP